MTEPEEVLEGDEKWHGTSGGYTNHKCRGPRCRQAWAEMVQRMKEKRAARPIPDYVHGTENGYGNYGCRCTFCTAAWSEAALNRKHKRDERNRFG